MNETEIIVCKGPPDCVLQGDDCIAAQNAGCHMCRRILIDEYGSEKEFFTKVN